MMMLVSFQFFNMNHYWMLFNLYHVVLFIWVKALYHITFFFFFLVKFIVLGGYILKVHSMYIQVEIVKCEIYSVLSQHLSTAIRAVGYLPPHYVDKESWRILHRFRPCSPVKT